MNGRVYDARLGRFLSPDPYVQAPDYSQSFNRYSYGWNNPLKYTDPDGEWVWLAPVIVGAIIGGYSGYKIGKSKGATGWGMAGYIFGGAAIGGIAGYTGFSLFNSGMAAGTAAGMGGISAGFNAGMLSGMVSGTITGGGMTALGGGSFIDVLNGATIGAWMGGVAGGFSGAIAGGFHNMNDQLNFWGTRLTKNISNVLASADNITYWGPNNGWLPWVTVRATNLMIAVAVREGMSQAAGYIFKGALIMSSVMTIGSTAAVVGAIGRAGVNLGTRGALTALRAGKTMSKAYSHAGVRSYVQLNQKLNLYNQGAIKSISKLTYSNRSIGWQRWIVRNNLHKGLRNVYNTNYEFFGTAQLKNMIEILTLGF